MNPMRHLPSHHHALTLPLPRSVIANIMLHHYLYLYLYLAVKYLDNIPEDQIAELNIPTGVPLVYSLDADLKPIPHANAIAPLQVTPHHTSTTPAL